MRRASCSRSWSSYSLPSFTRTAGLGADLHGCGRARPKLRYFLSGLDSAGYKRLLQDADCRGHDPANVVMEVHPEEQKTRPDFLLTEKLLGIRTVCITKFVTGPALFYEEAAAGSD